jgi:hypothetical protein
MEYLYFSILSIMVVDARGYNFIVPLDVCAPLLSS